MSSVDLAQLFNLHAQDVRRFLTSRVACDATAIDLTQEAFLRLARMPNLGAVENFRTYLFRIATNLATDHLRARKGVLAVCERRSQEEVQGADRVQKPGRWCSAVSGTSGRMWSPAQRPRRGFNSR